MDKTLKKSDISKRILETRKQTEELKAQLQNLIDSGINSSLEYKTTVHSHLDKENITESQNKVQIIKSYDTKHSQHITKPGSSRTNLRESFQNIKPENKERKARNYDVNKAREYIKKQREKRLEQQKLQDEEKKKVELQKQKLQELHKKSLELVTKNVQAKKEKYKSHERIDLVRPVKDIPRSRSLSREKGYINRNEPGLKDEHGRRGKSVERIKKIPLENLGPIDTNLLYPPPTYLLQTQERKTSSKNSPLTRNEIVILSGNNTDKKIETPKLDLKNETKPLKPKNLFNTPKNTNTLHPPPQDYELNTRMQINNSNEDEKIDEANKNLSRSFRITKNVSENTGTKVESRKQNSLEPKDTEVSLTTNGKSPLEDELNKNISVNDILEYKNTQNKNSSNINASANLKTTNSDNLVKPKSDHLEKFTKETQTNSEPKREFPSWLQEKKFESSPLNFINTVKRKLQYAINSPMTYVDVGVQSSLAQQSFKPDTPQNMGNKEQILEILQHSAKSSKKSDLKSFISHKCLNLDQKSINNLELIPKDFSGKHLTISRNTETESESDTSKNIPEISSESGTSIKKNAESVKQNGSIGLDAERLSSLKLTARNMDKDTHTIHLEELQTEATPHSYSAVTNGKSSVHINFDDVVDANTQPKGSVSKIYENDQYTSDFQSSSRSISTRSSLIRNKTTVDSKNADYQNLMDPQIMLHSEKHSSNIPRNSERHSKNTTTDIKINRESERSRNIVRNNNIGRNLSYVTSIQSDGSKDVSTNRKTISSNKSIETEVQERENKFEESENSEPITSVGISKKSDKYKSLYSDFHPSATISEMMSKSDSNLQRINTRRGSENDKFTSIPPLKEPTLSLVANEKNKAKVDKSKLLRNISLKSDKFDDQNNRNEIHLKFEAEIHLLNDFNESLRQFSEVEKAFNSLKSKNDSAGATNKILQNRDTQTSIITKSPSPSTKVTENGISDDKSELSSINFSRGFLINGDSSSLNVDTTVSKLDDTNNAEEFLNVNINNDLSNFENVQSHNFAGMTLRMFEQLIKDEDVRLENLKTILKIREQALLDRTKGELAWLEIQRKHLRETGKLHEASLIKKKQRGILVNHQKERYEMQRLKQMQKAASIERKIILKEQRNLIKHQLSTGKMLSKIKVNTPRERRLSGPLKVIQSHTESIRSETSFSRRSSSEKEKETYSVISHSQSIVSMVSEISGEEAMQKDGPPRAESTDLAINLTSEACGVPISQMKRTLLLREAALQKRRRAALELLQWHRKLLEEEKRITELESTANTIISQIPSNAPASPDVAEKYHFRGKQLNQLWFNLTGCEESKFDENKIYPMSQIALERFCKSAREYPKKTKPPRRASDSEVSEYSVGSISENIPVIHVASTRTESEPSHKHESVPVATANDYTSDFDIESLQNIVNVGNRNVMDESINELIDNFSKIQEDISSLSIKQSLKSDADLEPDESIISERTDSEVEISVIETAKTSDEAAPKLIENKEIKKGSSDDHDESKICEELSRSESSEDKIDTETPKSEVEESKEAKLGSDQVNNNYDKVIEEDALSVEGKNNLNTSKEILEELSHLESQVNEDISPDRSAFEDIQIADKAKDNLSKTEEILSRLSQSGDKLSIIAFNDNEPLESEVKISSEGIFLNLQPLEGRVANNVSSARETEQSLDKDRSSFDIDTSENIPISEKSPIIEDRIDTQSKDEEDIVLNGEKIDLNSGIETEGSSETKDALAKISGQEAVNEFGENSNKTISDAELLQNATSKIEKKSSHSISTEEISAVLESRTEIDAENDSHTKSTSAEVKDEPSNDFKGTVTEESSNKDNELIITEDSKKDIGENSESKSPKTTASEVISLEKSSLVEEKIEDVSDTVPSAIEEMDKSQRTPVPENSATLPSKEDINSLEEKELDSLSSSTTGSQTSVLSEREENQFSERSGSSEEKSPRSVAVNVKKRVSEIMADANQASRGDKSPKLQDFYTTTYDLVSPTNSPELGSPTEEYKYMTAKSIFGTEAEEILRKQLAIEQEIKQITEQQKEQLPYLFVREIPNKPPPPYTPPSSVPATNAITIVPTSEEIENITKYSAKILHKAYLSNNLDNISMSENTLSLISKDITKECYKFVFDLCKEISKEHYKQFETEECPAWLQVKKNARLAVVRPLDVVGLEKHMNKKLQELFGYEKPVRHENAIIKWSRKKRDHVDEILVMESQAEETQWTNYDKDELLVINEVTNDIMNMLLKETGEIFSKILSKQNLY